MSACSVKIQSEIYSIYNSSQQQSNDFIYEHAHIKYMFLVSKQGPQYIRQLGIIRGFRI